MNRGLILALAATLAAVWYVSGLEDVAERDDVTVVARVPREAGQAPAGDMPIVAAPVRADAGVSRDLFASHSFLPPPPRVAARPVPPPAPMAPPLPFRYQGRLSEEGGTTIFLAQGERVLVARVGDLLNNQYRVESVTNGAVTFLFEPLKQRQTLTIGNAK